MLWNLDCVSKQHVSFPTLSCPSSPCSTIAWILLKLITFYLCPFALMTSQPGVQREIQWFFKEMADHFTDSFDPLSTLFCLISISLLHAFGVSLQPGFVPLLAPEIFSTHTPDLLTTLYHPTSFLTNLSPHWYIHHPPQYHHGYCSRKDPRYLLNTQFLCHLWRPDMTSVQLWRFYQPLLCYPVSLFSMIWQFVLLISHGWSSFLVLNWLKSI